MQKRPYWSYLKVMIPILLFVASPFFAAANTYPRQVDPSVIQEQSPGSFGLLTFYSGLANMIYSGNFSYAIKQLNATGFVHIPAQLQYIYLRFNSLMTQAAQQLQQVNSSISEIRQSILSGKLTAANSTLSQAYFTLSLANVTIQQLKSAAPQFESGFGVPSGQIQKQISLLAQSASNYLSILNQFRSQIQNIFDDLATDRAFATNLKLQASSYSVMLGQSLTLYGNLTTSKGLPIENRSIEISSSIMPKIYTTTDSRGSFSITIDLPYVYVRDASFIASYTPSKSDAGSFLGSTSNEVFVALKFYNVSISLSTPSVALPGSFITVNGTFSSSNSSYHSAPQVRINAFGEDFFANITGARFSADIQVPYSIADGAYTIQASTYPLQLLAPSSASAQLVVKRLQPSLLINAPDFVIGGETLFLAGKAIASNGSSLGYSNITVILASRSFTVNADASGNFRLYIPVSFTVSTGAGQMYILVQPKQAWAASSTLRYSLIAMSPLTVILPGVIILLGMLIYTRRGVHAPFELETKREEEKARFKGHAVKIEGGKLERSQAAKAYFTVLEALSSKGLSVQKSETPREYLTRVSRNIPSIAEDFHALTNTFEEEVYGLGASEERSYIASLLAGKIIESLK